MGANGGGGGIVGGVDRCEMGLFTTAVAIACADATLGFAAVQGVIISFDQNTK